MRLGSLCSGYGGLDLAAAAHYGASIAWHAEIDRSASALLAHRWPDVPNLGDIKTVDWSAVEPVDILCAGYPCQPFSHAGKRRGVEDERHLWPAIARAVRLLRPSIIILENVAGHLRLGFDTVLADLAGLRFDARWLVVRASDAGAPHRRARLFVAATDSTHERIHGSGPQRDGRTEFADSAPPDSTGERLEGHHAIGTGRSRTIASLGTDRLLPTPTVVDRGRDRTPDEWAAWTTAMRSRHGNGNGHGASLSVEAQTIDPYLPALQRWEQAIGRHRPDPLQRRGDARPRLEPRFVEWMMGLPAGWVTDVPGISYSAQLKLLGNGVVPQQATLALRMIEEMP